jgi:hypothetical protein
MPRELSLSHILLHAMKLELLITVPLYGAICIVCCTYMYVHALNRIMSALKCVKVYDSAEAQAAARAVMPMDVRIYYIY